MTEAVFTDLSGKVRLIGSLTGATPASDAPQWTTRTLTSAELLDLWSYAVEIVPSPGAGKYLAPLACWLATHPGATPYAGDSQWLTLGYGPDWIHTGGQGNFWDARALHSTDYFASELLSAPDPLIAHMDTSPYNTMFKVTDIDDRPLSIVNNSVGPFTDGDGTLTVSVLYAIRASAALV